MSRAGGVGGSMGRGGGGGDIFKVGRSPAKKVNKVCSSPHSSINRFHTNRRLISPIRPYKNPDTSSLAPLLSTSVLIGARDYYFC